LFTFRIRVKVGRGSVAVTDLHSHCIDSGQIEWQPKPCNLLL